jgi:exonuclease VII small subunit
MKRAITALALVGALLLSVVACQVYNPTDNSTLSTAMRSEGATSWADYSKEFEEADAAGKYKLLAEYETFRKLHKDQAAWEGAVKKYEDAAAACKDAETAVTAAEKALKETDSTDKAALYDAEKAVAKAETALVNAEKAMKDARKAVLYTVEDLKALWDKEYDVRWDWNSKM